MASRLSFAVVLLFLIVPPAHATLIDLGDGTIYSTDLGYAFLRDMNTPRTTGFDATGDLWVEEAIAWIDHLNATRHLGYDDWQLAGSPNVGVNFLEHIFYVELGNARPAAGSDRPSFDSGPFVNVMFGGAGYYVSSFWFDAPCERAGDCWGINYRIHEDDYDGDLWPQWATAMRPASVPEPSTLLSLAVGFSLALVRRHIVRKHER